MPHRIVAIVSELQSNIMLSQFIVD